MVREREREKERERDGKMRKKKGVVGRSGVVGDGQ